DDDSGSNGARSSGQRYSAGRPGRRRHRRYSELRRAGGGDCWAGAESPGLPLSIIRGSLMVFTTTIDNGIAEMVFNKPPVNAFDSHGWYAIADEINALGRNDDVRVIIIRAEGKGFCAGVDIKELAADGTKIVDVNKGNYATFKAVHLNPKPVIVAVHGFVLGGGIGIAGAADI